MPTLTLEIPLDLMHSISSEAIVRNRTFEEIIVSTLSASFGALPPAVAPVYYEADVAHAVDRCIALGAGTFFSLNADFTGTRRLFSRAEWEKLSDNPAFRPTVFGRLFSKAITGRRLAETKQKTPDNKQIYTRL